MPLYDYECDCGQHAEAFRSVANRHDAPLCMCGLRMRKVYSTAAAISDLEPYYDDNLETHIESRQHRQRVMKEKGVSEKFGKGWK